MRPKYYPFTVRPKCNSAPDTGRGTHSRGTGIFLGLGTHVILMFERSENEGRVGRKSNFQASQKVRLSRVTFLVGWSDQVARNGESFFFAPVEKNTEKLLFSAAISHFLCGIPKGAEVKK